VWRVFDEEASQYETWYATPQGQRVGQAERALLGRLLAPFPEAQSILEIGCGTGHFTRWFTEKVRLVIGLDRAPTMLAEFRKTSTEVPIVLGDGHCLPIADGSVDLSVFVVTLEFLEDPQVALAEAMRVARRGVLLITLNPWSLGGLSRKIGTQSRGAILSRAKRFPIGSLRDMAAKAAGSRLQRILWTSTLFPDGLWRICFPIPLGDVLGLSLVLGP